MYDNPISENLPAMTIRTWKKLPNREGARQSTLGNFARDDNPILEKLSLKKMHDNPFLEILSVGDDNPIFGKLCRLIRMRDNPYLEILSFKCLLLNRL